MPAPTTATIAAVSPETVQQLAALSDALPPAIERCRALAAGAGHSVMSAVLAAAVTADTISRATELANAAAAKCAPPTNATLNECVGIAQEMTTLCAPLGVASAALARSDASPPAALPDGDALVLYRLTESEIVPCGSHAIIASAMHRLLSEQSALASRYPGSVEESYIAAMSRVVAQHDAELGECRKGLRATAAVAH